MATVEPVGAFRRQKEVLLHRRHLLATSVVAILCVGCGGDAADSSTTEPSLPTHGSGPGSDPGSNVVEAQLIYFDADGRDESPGEPPLVRIDGPADIDAFIARFVDMDPSLTGITDALADGKVVLGGRMSSGCFPASAAHLERDGNAIVAVADGVRDDEGITCVRAITSVALFAMDPADFPVDAVPDA